MENISEVELRAFIEAYGDKGDNLYAKVAVDLLNEARAEITQLHKEITRLSLESTRLANELNATRVDLCQLRAPPEADVMKRARYACYGDPSDTSEGLAERVARALTEYSDQRAMKERAEAKESVEFWMRAQAETAKERDEARAEIAHYKPLPTPPELRPEDFLRCLVTKNKCGTDTWAVGQPCQCENCQRWLRLRAPPEADVMKRAKAMRLRWENSHPTEEEDQQIDEENARALTEYSDQRAAKAETRATAMESFLAAAEEVIDHARREARAAVREEAVQIALAYRDEVDAGRNPDAHSEHSLGQGYAANIIGKRLRRVLADTPPQHPDNIGRERQQDLDNPTEATTRW